MTTPANHHLTVTTDAGTMRGTVIVVKQLGPGVANLTIETRDILPMGDYEAVYTTPSQEARGSFKVFQFSVSNNYRWHASGIFMRARRVIVTRYKEAS